VVAAERRFSGSVGQNNELEKRFQDQAVNVEKKNERRKDSRIRRSGFGDT
jgi:hypothetical protein